MFMAATTQTGRKAYRAASELSCCCKIVTRNGVQKVRTTELYASKWIQARGVRGKRHTDAHERAQSAAEPLGFSVLPAGEGGLQLQRKSETIELPDYRNPRLIKFDIYETIS